MGGALTFGNWKSEAKPTAGNENVPGSVGYYGRRLGRPDVLGLLAGG